MHIRKLVGFAGGLALLAPMAVRVNAQNEAPFSIQKPLDGATVREKVPIVVPLASIPEGGYVALSIDGQFRVALTPTPEQRANMKPGAKFVYMWDTKQSVKVRGGVTTEVPKDGEHELSMTLYAPLAGAQG